MQSVYSVVSAVLIGMEYILAFVFDDETGIVRRKHGLVAVVEMGVQRLEAGVAFK